MNKFVLMASLCLNFAVTFGQARPLSVGDTLPSVTLKNILNSPVFEIQSSNIKGKAIVLDFWASWCAACTKSLPLLDSFQSRFKDQAQVIVVAYEPAETVKKFLSKNAIAKKLRLPFIAADTTLRKWFPHRSLPHAVWIHPSGRIAGITGPEYFSHERLEALVAGLPLSMETKRDVLDYDVNKPLLQDGNGGSGRLLLNQSMFTSHIEGLFSGHRLNFSPDSLTRRRSFINQALLQLYYAAGMKSLPFANRLMLELSDPSHLFDTVSNGIRRNQWARENLISYEQSAPRHTPSDLMDDWMLQDLNKTFGLWGRVENRTVSCYALVCDKKGGDQLRATGGSPLNHLLEPGKKMLRNLPLSVLVQALNDQLPGQPLLPIVLDETGHLESVDLSLDLENLNDLSALRIALSPYGLDLQPVERLLPMLVISPKSQLNLNLQ